MSFLSLILKNPFRNKSRALLAIVGIGIGIATIVALGAVTDGLISSAEDTLHSGGTDITIMGERSSSATANMLGSNPLEDKWIEKISNITGVEKAIGMYSTNIPDSKNEYINVVGINPNDIKYAELTITDGKVFSDNPNDKEIIIGKLAKDQYKYKVGDKITFDDVEYNIVGVYESGKPTQDNGVFMHLNNTQKIADQEGNLSAIFVKVAKDVEVDTVTKNINSTYGDNITMVTSLSDMGMISDVIDLLHGASFGISLLAIIIGAVGIINTMLTSVMERTREIGVLKAVGWSNRRILLMIMGESIVITLVSAVVGSICGVIIVELGSIYGLIGGVQPIFNITTFLSAFVVAFIVGIIGGVYPASRAIKLPPTEALRYE